ncbi:MAG TPA: hypothetical protein DIT25_01470, partial [Candidatus Moranbacteria bacterium]|nr:hypothetical protein [Candidatus Moranbacteria bacterium]
DKYSASFLIFILGYAGASFFLPQQVALYKGTLKFFNDNYGYFSRILVDYSHSLIAVIFFFLGAYYLAAKTGRKKESLWLSLSALVPFFMAVFLWRRNTGQQYIFFAQSFLIILISSGIYGAAKLLQESIIDNSKKNIFYSAIILSLAILPNYAYFFSKNNTYAQTSQAENPRYKSVFAYFKKHRTADDVLITRNFRNYYWSGENVPVYSFGGELAAKKFQMQDLESILGRHPSGWFIFSDNDDSYISNDVIEHIQKNFEQINHISVRGKIKMYRWK